MDKLLPSRFSYVEGMTIRNTSIIGVPNDDKPAIGEMIIIVLLQKYGFLNAAMIQQEFNRKHRNIVAEKSLRKMQQRGLIEKYTLEYQDENPSMDIYILSKGYRESSNDVIKKRNRYKYDMSNIAYILEHLALNQWHMAITGNKNVKEIYFNKTIMLDGKMSIIPSFIKYKTNFHSSLYLCCLPVCKGRLKKDLGRFIADIALIADYLDSKSIEIRSYLIVIACESESQIEQISEVLSKVNETNGRYYLYTIDTITADIDVDPLTLMYEVKKDNGVYRSTIISLK